VDVPLWMYHCGSTTVDLPAIRRMSFANTLQFMFDALPTTPSISLSPSYSLLIELVVALCIIVMHHRLSARLRSYDMRTSSWLRLPVLVDVWLRLQGGAQTRLLTSRRTLIVGTGSW
jgi:hypothetical protein